MSKIFRDPIYGYISIPKKYCSDFIDTEIFQRLRRIEQTSMRVLYPSAHHDRFAHSIGVYFLGSIAFHHIHQNSHEFYLGTISPDDWKVFGNTFLIACLLHDCGHAPFSHTLENYYLYKKEEEIKEKISSYFKDEPTFSKDYDASSPSPHEKISALILLSEYNDAIVNNDALPLLAARMIMGCKYEEPESINDRFKNKLISLLNGTGIDVDSVDYIQRDSWTSGVSNVNIDYHRLFSSIMIKPDDDSIPQIVFKKQVLSVLENIIIGRNFLYKWIYSHHKVIYEQDLIKSIINKINQDNEEDFFKKIFSVDSFFEHQSFRDMRFYLPTDDDIIYTFKKFYESDEKIQELFSRKHKYKALWKSYFEFNDSHFKNVSDANRMKIFSKINKGKFRNLFNGEILYLKVEPKLKSINANDFLIDIDGELVDASQVTNLKTENLKYFIVYVTDEVYSKKRDIIKYLISLQS